MAKSSRMAEDGKAIIAPESSGTVFFAASFADKEIRARFVRKVYGLLLSQLAVTAAIIAVVVYTPSIRQIYCDRSLVNVDGDYVCVRSQNGLIIYIVSYVVFFVTYLTIACCEGMRKRFPTNIITMGIFTLALSMMTSSIAVYHSASWVMTAMGLTAGVCLGLTFFAFQTKFDVTGWGPYLFAACWVLFLFGILAIIFSTTVHLKVISLVYSGLFALLFSLFLVYDTQRIMGGKRHSISAEEHVLAAILIYVDVVYIFMGILGLGGGRS